MKSYTLILLFVLSLLFASCTKDPSGETLVSDSELTISGLNDTEWIYVSLTSGEVIGKSAKGDYEEDAKWKARNDWDVAFCGEYIRTNGGTSGNGNGAIKRIDSKSYEEVTSADATSLQEDQLIK